uniref:Uncharacterized protein n=1 Tax=Arundo donax TaxID=35708 RepID=A0A0A9C1X8_ARUDO
MTFPRYLDVSAHYDQSCNCYEPMSDCLNWAKYHVHSLNILA